jgi:hypothetical protein
MCIRAVVGPPTGRERYNCLVGGSDRNETTMIAVRTDARMALSLRGVNIQRLCARTPKQRPDSVQSSLQKQMPRPSHSVESLDRQMEPGMEHLDTAKFYEWLDSLKIGAVPEGPPATRFIPWKLGCAVGSCSRRRLDD